MNFYLIDTLGKYTQDSFCIAEGKPEGLSGSGKKALKYGGVITGVYPDDPYEVIMRLDEDSESHIKRGDFISTTEDYVMISQEVVDELSNFNIPDTEFCPFTLLNHKERVHSTNYRFVVPKAPFDAVDEGASDISRTKNNTVIGKEKIVFSQEKVKSAPDMFRVNDLREMAFSESLAKKLESQFSNFVFKQVEVL